MRLRSEAAALLGLHRGDDGTVPYQEDSPVAAGSGGGVDVEAATTERSPPQRRSFSTADPSPRDGATLQAGNRSAVLAAIEKGLLSPHDGFRQLVPARPYCADDVACGVLIRRRDIALRYRHLQISRPGLVDWLAFDIDRDDAFRAHEDGNLPPPTVIAVNPHNGHAHAGYLLRQPVQRLNVSDRRPLNWLADIQRGYTRRLGADRSFHGVVVKNPRHRDWRTLWLVATPFSLDDLDCALDRHDKRPEPRAADAFGEGRNATIFNAVRRSLYPEAVALLGRPGGLEQRMEELAAGINRAFAQPLSPREVASIVRSITRWIRAHFSAEQFSEIQSHRARGA